MIKGIIFDIKRYAIHDGPGIRTTVFFKGCAASCWWCHNPESQAPEIENNIRKNTFDGRMVEEEELIGKVMTVDQVISEIEKDQVFYDESGGGVTISGGEPLMQPDFLRELLIHCKNEGIHTALDTTGYAPEEVFKSIMDFTDLFLFDIKFIDNKLHQKYAGVSNETILTNLKILVANNKNITLRLPVIPGITDGKNNIEQIIDFVLNLDRGGINIDILPYHRIARHKYEKLNKEYLMNDTNPPSEQIMLNLKNKLEHAGLQVNIGG